MLLFHRCEFWFPFESLTGSAGDSMLPPSSFPAAMRTRRRTRGLLRALILCSGFDSIMFALQLHVLEYVQDILFNPWHYIT